MADHLRFILHQTYFASLDRLASAERGKVAAVVERFRTDPQHPGLRLHALEMSDHRIHSISPNMNLRATVLIDGRVRAVLYADHHDPAYDWAKWRMVEADPGSGQLQLIRCEEIVRQVPAYLSQETAPPLAFAGEPEEYLLGLGCPRSS